MDPNELEYDDLDRLISITLQKSGKMLPIDLDEELSPEVLKGELPAKLQDLDSLVDEIFDENPKTIDFHSLKNRDIPTREFDDELRLAARHGVKLSDETIKKLRDRKSKE